MPPHQALRNKLALGAPIRPADDHVGDRTPSGGSIGPLTDAVGEKAKYYKMVNLCSDWLNCYFPHVLTKIGEPGPLALSRTGVKMPFDLTLPLGWSACPQIGSPSAFSQR